MKGRLYARTRFQICGDRAMLVEYGEGVDPSVNEKVRAMALLISRRKPAGVETVIPAYRCLAVGYDPLRVAPDVLQANLLALEGDLEEGQIEPARTVDIPVRYGGEDGPDLAFVAAHNHLTPDEVIRIHCQAPYHIYAVGFAPGFCYLGGLDPRLHTPRLATPRTRVPAGSVGIAESQTGVYPSESPGGWQLIGRTPLTLFDPFKTDPFLYQPGDRIRFVPVSPEGLAQIREHQAS
ncbi:MAG: 5-oxoprolinase subunit PxpB [Desulfosarcina sp.]